MSTLPVIPDDVDGNIVRAFALGYLESAFAFRPRSMAILAEAMSAGIESERAARHPHDPTYVAPDEALLIDRSERTPDEVQQ